MRSLEDLIKDTSGTNLAQVFIVGFVALSRGCMGWCLMTLSFANFVPKWCCLPDNPTATPNEYCGEEDQLNGSIFGKMCKMNESSCSSRVFATGVRTIVYEWDLVCERKWMVPITTSIIMAGLLLGGLLAGQMSDLFGRKKTLYFFTATCAMFCFVAAFSISWEMFAAAIFLIGTSLGAYFATGVPYTSEFVIPSSRSIVSTLPSFNIGVCLMALTAWRLQDWSKMYLISGVMIIPLLLPYFFIPESLRWLTVKGRVDEAQRVVEWIARWNKQEVPKDSLEVIKAVAEEVKSTDETTKYTYIHIYKGWHLFKTSLILQYIWFCMSMCGYGISFGVSSFGTNVYLNIFLLQAISMPGFIGVNLAVPRIGIKKTAIMFMILASACGFASMTVNLILAGWDKQVLTIAIFNLLCRGLLSAGWATIGVATNETYPTVIRGLGFGASNVAARIGAMVSPFLLNFEDGPTLALAVVGGSLLTTAFAVTFLQETSGKALKESNAPAGQTTDIELKIEAPKVSIYVIENAANTHNIGDSEGPPIKNGSSRM